MSNSEKNSLPVLAMAIPCFNEEAALPETFPALENVLEDLKKSGIVSSASFILYVDDGSADGTWSLLAERCASRGDCRAIKLAHNSGHQNALLAGMDQALLLGADCVATLDADLQDDPGILAEMFARRANGAEIVYAARSERKNDTLFKRSSAAFFYKLMGLMGIELTPNHADFRLVGKKALEALSLYGESGIFLRGIFPAMGFPSAVVYYKRQARKRGESKYPLRKMINFAWSGITSFSAAPLRVAGVAAAICLVIALAMGGWALWSWIKGSVIVGWTSIMAVILFLGSVQLACIALQGEYIAKIFYETRKRPRYIIEKKI